MKWWKGDAPDLYLSTDIAVKPDVTAYEAAVLALTLPTFQNYLTHDISLARQMLWTHMAPIARFVTVIRS